MRKVLSYGFIFCSLGLILIGLKQGKFKNKTPKSESAKTENPGWEDQYFMMKKNEAGVIPSGVYYDWARQVRFNKTGESSIENLQELGPFNVGGRTRAILVDHSNVKHILAGGISGGLWESYNGGYNWKKVNDFAPNISVSCITQNPFDASVIYYGTGESSSNKGAIKGMGVFKSTDGGATFQPLMSTNIPEFEFIWSIEHSLTDSNTLYVGTKKDGLYRSTDGGETFTKLYSTTNGIHDIEVFQDSSVMFTMNGVGVYKATKEQDLKQSDFTKLSGGLPTSGFGRVEIAYCESVPSTMYAQFASSNGQALQGIFKSTNGGSTWTATASPSISYAQAWYDFVLAVKPDNPNRVITAAVQIAYTNNGGTSWASASNSHSDYHRVVFIPGSDSLFIGNDGGVYKYFWGTINSGYKDLNSGYNTTQFYAGAFFPTGTSITGGTQDNGSHLSMNAAQNFKKLYGADGAFTSVNQQNPAETYISYQYGQIMKTTNVYAPTPSFTRVTKQMDANSDGTLDDGGWFINPFEINMLDGNQLYFPTYKRLWRTTNGTGNWTPITNNIGISSGGSSLYAVGLSNDLEPMAYVGGSGLIFYRIDNVVTATPGSEKSLRSTAPSGIWGSFISSIKVHPFDKSIVYISLSNFSSQPRVYKITKADTETPKWTPINGNLPSNLPVNWVEIDPLNPDMVFFAGTDFGLFSTRNGGATWTKEESLPNVSVHNIRIRQSDRKMFIFTHGRGCFAADLKQGVIATSVKNEVSKPVSLNFFPNPAVSDVNFTLGLENEEALVEVFSTGGQMIKSEKILVGASNTLDVSGLAKGIYIVNVNSNGRKFTGKFVRM